MSLVESIEFDALETWFLAAAASDSGRFRWSRFRQGDAMCYISTSEPSILVNRVLGIGSEYRPTPDVLSSIRKTYASAGVGRFFLHVIPEQLGDDYETLLTDAGYVKYRGWMKFVRGNAPAEVLDCDFAIRRIGPAHAAAFASIAGNAFDFHPGFHPAIAALVNDENWQLYVGFDGTTPACTGGLYMKDGVGYLDFGATHPDFRRHGGQAAILNTRIRAAIDAGCDSIVTMTGEAAPGDEQHSYRNILRAGFGEAYLRENWIPAGT